MQGVTRSSGRLVSVVTVAAVCWFSVACTPTPPPQGPPVIDRFDVTASGFTDPAVVPVAWTVHDPNGDPMTCRFDLDGDGTFDLTVSPCPASGARNISAGEGTHTATIEVSDEINAPVTSTVTYTVAAGPTAAPFAITVNVTTPPDQALSAAVAQAVDRWERVIARALPPEVVHADAGTCGPGSPAFDGTVTGLVVNLAVVPVAGERGESAPCVNGADGLPRLSFINLDVNGIGDVTPAYLADLVTHEMGHALGFTGPAWWAFREDVGADGFRFDGPRAMAAWSQLGGQGAVPLSNGGDHWNQPTFRSELMTCYLQADTPVHPISILTVSAMADIGYHVDLDAAEPYTLPAEPGSLTC